MAARGQQGEDDYVPVGIEEVEREGAPPKAPKARAAPKSSAGAIEFEYVSNGAKRTLAGLRSFEWASLFASLSTYISLPVIGLLALVGAANIGAVDLGGALPWVGFTGWILGVTTFGFFIFAAFFVILGVRASHQGQSELGVLQRRAVVKAESYFWRGVYTLIPGAGVALVLGFQEATPYREAAVPYATVLALAAGFVSGAIAARYFAAFLSEYLRNLTPRTGAKGRRRFRISTVIAASIPLAVVLAGTPLLWLDYDNLCIYLGACPEAELWTVASPSYGPPAHISKHLVNYIPLPLIVGMMLVVGLLLFGRVFTLVALRSYRAQLREAEILLREKVRARAPPAMPPG